MKLMRVFARTRSLMLPRDINKLAAFEFATAGGIVRECDQKWAGLATS